MLLMLPATLGLRHGRRTPPKAEPERAAGQVLR
jgi:hypothetical protein